MHGSHTHDPSMAAATAPSWPMCQARKGWEGRSDEQKRHFLSKLCLFTREGSLSIGTYHHVSLAKTVRWSRGCKIAREKLLIFHLLYLYFQYFTFLFIVIFPLTLFLFCNSFTNLSNELMILLKTAFCVLNYLYFFQCHLFVYLPKAPRVIL